MLCAMPSHVQSQTLRRVSVESPRSPQAQASAVVIAYLQNTQLASRNAAFKVVQWLAEETSRRADAGLSTDFMALNIQAAVAPEAVKDASGWLSPLWTRLVVEEAKWHEGMADTARRVGLEYVPRLEKVPGSPAIYRIAAEVLTEQALAPAPALSEGGIFYTPESIAAPGAFVSRAMRSGTVRWTTGLRWTLMLSVMAVLLTVLALWWAMLYFGGRISRPLSPADVIAGIVLVALAWGLRNVFKFFYELFDLRIVIAPSMLTPLSKDNVTLELRPSIGGGDGELVFARYSSTCAACGASVLLFAGGADFPGRIVGRCRRAGREHVFSFDPTTKLGRPLRRS